MNPLNFDFLKKSNDKSVSANKTERPILIIDGFNFFLRHFIVNGTTNGTGEPVGGVVGFLKGLVSLTDKFVPKQIYVVWEQGGGCPRRKKIFEGYKANRVKDKDMFKDVGKDSVVPKSHNAWILDDKENRLKQLHLLTQVMKNIPVCQIYLSETECDDIIGYLVKYKFKQDQTKKIIVSSDKDFYQLLEDENVLIYDQSKHDVVNADKVIEKYGISARNFCLAKVLSGDPSDNINGIEGMGFKTAIKRFPELANKEKDILLSDILQLAEEKSKDKKNKVKIFSEVVANKDLLERNWKLMYFDTSNLSASQIEKINYAVDNFIPGMNKLGLIKSLIDSGVSTDIDYDRISVLFKTTLLE